MVVLRTLCQKKADVASKLEHRPLPPCVPLKAERLDSNRSFWKCKLFSRKARKLALRDKEITLSVEDKQVRLSQWPQGHGRALSLPCE